MNEVLLRQGAHNPTNSCRMLVPCLALPCLAADAAQICQALQQGLLPQTVPRSWAPAPEPRPIKRVRRATSADAAACATGLVPVQAAVDVKLPPAPAAAAAAAVECCVMAPPLPVPVPRRASTTPRLPPQPLLEDAPADFLA